MSVINPHQQTAGHTVVNISSAAAIPWSDANLPHKISNTINTSLRIDSDSIVIGDQTLSVILQNLQEQIALLVPSLELHKEYAELRELYDQYQTKRNEIKEKRRMWETLKSNG